MFLGIGQSSHVSYYNHGQYEGAKRSGTFGTSMTPDDNHQSPLKPHEYLNYRVEPAFRYYQSQLPLYYRSRVAAEVVLVAGAFVGTLLAFFGIASWAAIATSITSAVTAWKEFNGTDKKLTRYSNTIGKLKGTVMWWEQLSEVEQASLANVNRLVLECEDTLEREREAWLSTSMATKALVKAASGDLQGGGNQERGKRTRQMVWAETGAAPQRPLRMRCAVTSEYVAVCSSIRFATACGFALVSVLKCVRTHNT